MMTELVVFVINVILLILNLVMNISLKRLVKKLEEYELEEE